MRLLGRPIGIWIASAYLLGLLALEVSNPGSPLWFGSPFTAASVAVLLLGIVLMMSLSRWAVLFAAVMVAMQTAFYGVMLLNPPRVGSLLGLGSQGHEVYVVPIEYHAGPLAFLAASAAILLYSASLWRRGDLG